jgi:hypothetical protein
VQIRRDNHNTDTTLFPVSAEQSLLPVFSLWPPPPPPSVHTETDGRTKVDKRTGGKKEKALDGRFHLTPETELLWPRGNQRRKMLHRHKLFIFSHVIYPPAVA